MVKFSKLQKRIVRVSEIASTIESNTHTSYSGSWALYLNGLVNTNLKMIRFWDWSIIIIVYDSFGKPIFMVYCLSLF